MTKPKVTQPSTLDCNQRTPASGAKYTISFTTSQPAAQEIFELVSRSATPGTRISIYSHPLEASNHQVKTHSGSLPSSLPERFDDFAPTY